MASYDPAVTSPVGMVPQSRHSGLVIVLWVSRAGMCDATWPLHSKTIGWGAYPRLSEPTPDTVV